MKAAGWRASAAGAAWWLVPPLVCIWLYWLGIRAWFQADDFAWLGLRQEIKDWPGFVDALFGPRAQGTIRPLSERAFFLVFYSLFGLDALPFRIWAFLTQAVNLVLLASIVRRVTGSRAAGFWAAIFWTVNSSLAFVMTWTSAYNQAMCAFFLLLAFHFLLKFIETGRRRYEVLEWAVFLAGFGAQELNLVYPALAAAYTLLCARKYFRRTLPLFVPSVLYVALHLALAPAPGGLYTPYYDLSMLRTLFVYWSWTAGPTWLLSPWQRPEWVMAGVALVTAALVGFAAWRAWLRDFLPLFFLAWYVAAIGPLLPLRDHLTEYYPYVAAMGFAMLAGTAFVSAWRRGAGWKAVAVGTAAVYLLLVVPRTMANTRYLFERSRRVERLVLGLERAHELHPRQAILLHGVPDELFGTAILDRPYRLFDAQVFLAPGSEAGIAPRPEYGEIRDFVLPADATARALDQDSVVVYEAGGGRLKNITRLYSQVFQQAGADGIPRRVDAGNPLLGYLLGKTWYRAERWSRWMPRRATVRMGGPVSAAQKLYVHGSCPAGLLAAGPLDMRLWADELPLGGGRVEERNASFDFVFDLPRQLQGKAAVTVTVEAGRTFRPAGDNRDLSCSFGTFEIR